MKKRLMNVGVLLCASAVLMAGCGKTSDNGSTESSVSQTDSGSAESPVSQTSGGEKVLRLGATTGFFGAESLDPGYNWDGWIMSIYGISENLFRLDENYTPQPWLAESYENADDVTWTFELRDDVYFSNGNQMTAESVKNCFARTYEQNERADSTLPIESVEADGQTLTVRTSRPVPTMLNDLCDPLLAVYDADSEIDENLGASCTGPFVATAFEAMTSVSMVKNEKYWGGEPKVDRIELSIIDDESALTAALQNGDIDLIAQLDAADTGLFSDTSDYTIDAVTTTRTNFLMYNLEHAGVSDVAVRNAIGYCVDRQSFADIVYNGYASVSYGIYPESMSFGGSEDYDITVDSYDPEKAAQILADAGYEDTDGDGILDKDGEKLSFEMVTYNYNNAALQLSDMLYSELTKLGIEVNIDTYEVLDDTMAAGDFDIAILSYAMSPIGTPNYFANMMFTTDSSNNYGHYSNAKVDEITAKMNESFDEDEKITMAKEINQELLHDAPFDFIIHQQLICAYNKKVTGVVVNPTEYYLVTNTMDIEE